MNEEKEVLPSSGILVLCSTRTVNVVSNSKNKEAPASLFFSCRQRSKVIARVTQKSLTAFFDYFRAYLALAEGSTPIALLPMVACLLGLWSKPALYLPMVASVSACPSVLGHSEFHNLKCNCYGK